MTDHETFTEDDREALANLIPLGFTERDPVRNVYEAADRIIAAGFRRAPAEPAVQSEPTDVMVDAACRVYWDRGPTEFTFEWMTRALRAALTTKEGQDR